MRFSFINQGKTGSLVVENGNISSIELVCEKNKTILKDLFSTRKITLASSIKEALHKFGYHGIEFVCERAKKINEELIEANVYGALSIIEDGQEVLSKGYGFSNIEDSLQNKASTSFPCKILSEVYAATAFHMLAERNLIALDDSIEKYFPYHCTRWPNLGLITLEMLLTQTSGLAPLQTNTTPMLDDIPSRMQVDQLFKRPTNFKPGQFYSYSQANYRVLGAILEHIMDMPYPSILKELGLTKTKSSLNSSVEYLQNGKRKRDDHVTQRTCFDDIWATTEELSSLCQVQEKFLSKKNTATKFGKNQIISQACGLHCDFIFGHRVYYRYCEQSFMYLVPKKKMKIVLLTNKPMPETLSMKKFISLITTNHF